MPTAKEENDKVAVEIKNEKFQKKSPKRETEEGGNPNPPLKTPRSARSPSDKQGLYLREVLLTDFRPAGTLVQRSALPRLHDFHRSMCWMRSSLASRLPCGPTLLSHFLFVSPFLGVFRLAGRLLCFLVFVLFILRPQQRLALSLPLGAAIHGEDLGRQLSRGGKSH